MDVKELESNVAGIPQFLADPKFDGFSFTHLNNLSQIEI